MAGGAPAEPAPAEPQAQRAPIYTRDSLAAELRQSEIISGLIQALWNPSTEEVEFREHPYAVVLTQDCDLLWDYEKRQKDGAGSLDSVLLYTADPAHEVRARTEGRDIWKRIIQNNDERYHLLEFVGPEVDICGEGIGGLILDFKSFFTLPPEDIYRQIESQTARRRCRLEMPYREHLQCRAAYYFQRVTLPTPHQYKVPAQATASASA